MLQASKGTTDGVTPTGVGRAAWRQLVAPGLMVLAGFVSLGTLFFPWTQYTHVGASACPTCGLDQNVPVDDFTHALTHGAPLLPLALSVLVYSGVPLAFIVVGLRRFFSRQPMRGWWRALLIVTAALFLGAVFFLQIGFGLDHVGDPGVTGTVGAAEWVALAAPITVVIASVLMPGRGRTQP